jgi:hypothetical protein
VKYIGAWRLLPWSVGSAFRFTNPSPPNKNNDSHFLDISREDGAAVEVDFNPTAIKASCSCAIAQA